MLATDKNLWKCVRVVVKVTFGFAFVGATGNLGIGGMSSEYSLLFIRKVNYYNGLKVEVIYHKDIVKPFRP